MRNYQLVLLLKSDTKKEQKQKIVDEVKTWIGEVKNDTVVELGEKKLSFPIKRERKADYMVLEFDTERIQAGLAQRLKMQDNILRHLLVRND